jgi:ABC-2 type transport system ATP-binding protein
LHYRLKAAARSADERDTMKLHSFPVHEPGGAAGTPVSAPRPPLVAIQNLTRSYRGKWGRRIDALSGVTLEARAGEVTGLLGPNGAGKTTTLKILLGMLRPSGGTATLFGRPATDPGARARLGFLTEQPYFYDYLTAREFLGLCGALSSMPNDLVKRRSTELLERMGLAASADLRLRKFSKGMMQRLGLAQALLHDPELVILDEPMSGLDPMGRSLVRDVILQLKRQGTTVLFSSHVLPDVETLCDRVYILAGGRVVAHGAVADLVAEAEVGFEIVASDIPAPTRERLGAQGARLRAAGSRTLVSVADRAAMNRAVSELLAAGAELIGVSPTRSPLEAHFVSAVGGAGAAGHDGGPAESAGPASPPESAELPLRTGTDR